MYEKVLIMETALDLFAEKGYYRTTIEEIASRTDLKKTTIYRLIKSKEELFLELLNNAASARKREVFDNIDLTDDLREKLSRFILSYIRFAKNQTDYYKILIMDVLTDNLEFREKVAEVQGEFKAVIYQILQDGIRQGQFRKVNPLIASIFLGKIIEGTLETIEVEPNYSPDQIVLSVMDLVWNGLIAK